MGGKLSGGSRESNIVRRYYIFDLEGDDDIEGRAEI